MHPSFYIGHLRLESYTFFTYLGVFAAGAYAFRWLVYSERFDRFHVMVLIILMFVVTEIGGSIIPFVYRWHTRGSFPSDLIFSGGGGRYFHSALLSGILLSILYAKMRRWSMKRILDTFAVSACIASAIGRIGCYLTGCCGGKPTDLPWGVIFPSRPAFKVHPTQLYHLFFESLILLPLLLLIQNRKRFEGQTFLVFMFVYSLFRFGIEYLRTNPIIWNSMTHAQIFSLVVMLFSAIGYAYYAKKAPIFSNPHGPESSSTH